jgi:bifunctional DNA-binding transcriptional regulator/antitoxin component of YhaV-PrlF toxin-antitoxin module
MSETEELKVGKRGEIYTTQKIRMKTGLIAGGRVIATVEEKKLIVQPKPTALNLLEKPRINPEPLSPEELSQLRKELAKEIETR